METLTEGNIACGHRILVVGIGPGHPDYIVPTARTAIEKAKVLIGGHRALEQFGHAGQEQMAITRDIPGVLAFVRERLREQEVVVMVSGDPGYFSMLDALRREFPMECIQVIPGISAMQLAFSRLALPWHEASLLSFHGRVPEAEKLRYEEGTILGMLTDGEYDSHSIPELLMRKGWPKNAELAICARLSYEDEQVLRTTLGQALALPPVKHGILIVQG